mmetsp:Transcript_13655/g.18911  ORF Transcript_13655/g.18911 Transcript_13655/m.18911 type:complete len:219 (-) Transcript_13655:604-1260(-)
MEYWLERKEHNDVTPVSIDELKRKARNLVEGKSVYIASFFDEVQKPVEEDQALYWDVKIKLLRNILRLSYIFPIFMGTSVSLPSILNYSNPHRQVVTRHDTKTPWNVFFLPQYQVSEKSRMANLLQSMREKIESVSPSKKGKLEGQLEKILKSKIGPFLTSNQMQNRPWIEELFFKSICDLSQNDKFSRNEKFENLTLLVFCETSYQGITKQFLNASP